MSEKRIDFLYLDEQDMIKAGVTDMARCVDVMSEVFNLMGQGDYIMGGRNHNSHGIRISFPDEPKFPRMPKNGPDRRFMAMTAYLGGRFHVAGEKWYGSNLDNLKKGLPRSILMCMLNDADTGQPLALTSGNLVSAVRTGAIPGVGARYLARKDSKVIGVVGAGPIGRTCLMSLLEVCKSVDTVNIYDINKEASEKLAQFIRENFAQVKTINISESMAACCKDADVINSATSGKVAPRFTKDILKPGVLVSLPASIDPDKDFLVKDCRKVVDNWKMYEAWAEEVPAPYGPNVDIMGCYFMDWVEDGTISANEIDNLGDIVSGKILGRKSDDEIIFYAMGGQPVYDVAWTYECYKKAQEMGLGTKLNLWEKPYLY